MKRLKSMTVQTILKSYAFPHKFYVRYALDCALTVKHLMTDDRSLKALEVTELWLQGKATDEEVKVARSNASSAATSCASYDSYASAAHATIYVGTTSYAVGLIAYAVYLASSRNTSDTTLKDILLKQIETLSEFQRLMLGIEV